MLSKNGLLYTLALRNIPKVGDVTTKKLIVKFGSAYNLFKAVSDRQKIDVSEKLIAHLQDPKHLREATTEIAFIEKHQINYWYFQDQDYPYHLKQCSDGPVVLFYKGDVTFDSRSIISVVGTRNSTSRGVDFLEGFFEEIAAFNPIIVSGLAYGIDITAHKLAIKHGLTNIACLGHGLDRIYPAAHRKYRKDIEVNGAFITDFRNDDIVSPINFVQRNRIVAGISQATVVVESAIKGGAMTTADMAFSYDRDVFAVPGRPSDIYSKGCNALIKSQKAQILNDAGEFIATLGWAKKSKPTLARQQQLFVPLNPDEQQIYDYLKTLDDAQFDDIIRTCKITTPKVSVALLNMELKGVIKTLPGKVFKLI